MESTKFDFNDILIVPEGRSNINSRKEINIFDENGMLPIMAAPMDTVIDYSNVDKFNENKIIGVLPRGNVTEDKSVSINPNIWLSYGLDEFEYYFIKNKRVIFGDDKVYALIDIANGNIPKLFDFITKAKGHYGSSLVLMVGNVANPNTYAQLSAAGADYVRLGVGNGSGCLTSKNTAVGYPQASLIVDTQEIRWFRDCKAKIVADGGVQDYADVIKALALGADYVMMGGVFNKAYEAVGDIYEKIITREFIPFDVSKYDGSVQHMISYKSLYHKFRGMSTKEVQKSWGKDKLTTSEGIVKYNKIEYTLSGWVENFSDYLASAMSYTGSKDLSEFIGKVNYVQITQNAFQRFNK